MRRAAAFAGVRDWIFDLDNTLYPSGNGILDAMHARSTLFIARRLALDNDAAHRLKCRYQQAYGTAARGLLVEHGIAPEQFQDFVHDVDLGALSPSAPLLQAMLALPGRRLVHTNAPPRHAQAVIERLGIGAAIDGVADITTAGHVPKPHPVSYERLLSVFGVEPPRACMFEDQPQNLVYPAALGMTTVLVPTGTSQPAGLVHVHHVAPDLEGFLRDIVRCASGVR